jgi:pSer/pThr/pTyr-binding forkhead associated (FHA) protein
MKRWFTKRRKPTSPQTQRAASDYVDSDETIVINMSAEERFAPDEVRVQFEADTAEPDPMAQTPAAPASAPGSTANADDDHTQIWTAGEVTSEPVQPSTDTPASAAAIDVGLTAGLLVLTEGPQRGRVFAVNLGRNRIGRGPENDIILDTGDTAISKDDHLVLAADPKNQRYFLVPGNSTNLAYVDDQPLLESCEIVDKAVIQIGETKVLFIQLFGNYLEWS